MSIIKVKLDCPDCKDELLFVQVGPEQPYHACPRCGLRFQPVTAKVICQRFSRYIGKPPTSFNQTIPSEIVA